jgi:hypothetical protein
MYATIRRYEVNGPSIADLVDAGHRFGTAVSRTPGFVAAVAVEETGGALLTIGLFDDRASLVAAEAFAEQWTG